MPQFSISLALRNAVQSDDALRAFLSYSSSCERLFENKECEYDQPSELADRTRVRLIVRHDLTFPEWFGFDNRNGLLR
jgi:hypothetical protein